MIYVCVPCRDEAATIGLQLWKIRQVFAEFPREYHLVVLDDGSTDASATVLERYTKVLPLTVLTQRPGRGYGAALERLARHALELTDRPKRDYAVFLHADFRHDAQALPELVKRLDSGADLVVAEGTLVDEPDRRARWFRRYAPWLLRGAVRVPGIRDTVSGFLAFRLVTLRHVFGEDTTAVMQTDGWAANAELASRGAAAARRVERIAATERHSVRERASRHDPWTQAKALWRAARVLRRLQPNRPPVTAPQRPERRQQPRRPTADAT